MSQTNDSAGSHPRGRFHTTQWSVVLAAGVAGQDDAAEAMARLCEAYWQPIYAFVRRRTGGVHDAQDLTQAFFTHLLEKNAVGRADRERGRFRSFLLAALKNFLTNEAAKAQAQKRGGGRRQFALRYDEEESRIQYEPHHDLTPERLFDRRWALALLDRVLERLRLELDEAGKIEQFDHLKNFLTGGDSADYEQAAESLSISPAAAKQAAYRMRRRYRELLREETASTIAEDDDVDDELGRLMEALSAT